MSERSLRKLGWAVLGLGLLAAADAGGVAPIRQAAAQDAPGLRVYDEQLRVRLDEQAPRPGLVDVDGGGWINLALFKFDDSAAQRFRTLRQYELRLWASANLQGAHRFYVRSLLGWNDWNSGDNPTDVDGDTFSDFEIERAWYEFDLAALLLNRTGRRPDYDLKLKVGRAYHTLGTGLVLAHPLDAIRATFVTTRWDVTALLGMTIHDTRNPLDQSPAMFQNSDFCVWGFELGYRGLDRHRPFAYFLSVEDNTNPDPDDPTQRYDYSPRYVGLGSEGTLLPDLRYRTELVGQWGDTFSDGVAAGGQDPICAMAYDLFVEYVFRCPTRPFLQAEYLFASGDSDRQTSAVATVGGNVPDTTDHAFNAMGFRDTGVAFAPAVSNLHMYMVGGGLYPLENQKRFENLEVGSKVFFYHKAADGAVSVADASTNNSRWLGWEWDVYCNWRITSDLAWTLRYGAFQPGAAFANDDCRHFLYTGMTFSF